MRKLHLALMAALALLTSPAAFAGDHELDGLEMDVMDPNSTPHDASELTLPDEASTRAHEQEHAQNDQDDQDDVDEVGEDRDEAESTEGDVDEDMAEVANGGDHGDAEEPAPAGP